MVQAFLKKWWVESDFKAPNLPLSLRLKVSGCHYNSIYNNTPTKQVRQSSQQHQIRHTLINKIFSTFLFLTAYPHTLSLYENPSSIIFSAETEHISTISRHRNINPSRNRTRRIFIQPWSSSPPPRRRRRFRKSEQLPLALAQRINRAMQTPHVGEAGIPLHTPGKPMTPKLMSSRLS